MERWISTRNAELRHDLLLGLLKLHGSSSARGTDKCKRILKRGAPIDGRGSHRRMRSSNLVLHGTSSRLAQSADPDR